MTDQNTNGYDDEEMTVELELEDGQMVNCAVITILTVDKKDYIALLPLHEDGGTLIGHMLALSYVTDQKDKTDRPVTFCWNGGPGGSSAMVNIGGLGPRRAAHFAPCLLRGRFATHRVDHFPRRIGRIRSCGAR